MRTVVKIFFSVAILFFAVACNSDRYVAISGYAQGGTYVVKINLKGVFMKPESIRLDIDSILLRIDNSVSGYNRGSLLSRFNAGEKIVPDDIFLELYKYSYYFYKLTGGAFDPACGALFDLWGFGFKNGEFPSAAQVEATRRSCGMALLREDIEAAISPDGTLFKDDLLLDSKEGKNVALNYNAIAQGYSSDLVARYLYSIGVRDMLVDIGGEIYCAGRNPSGQAWRLGVDKPVDGNDTPGVELEGVVDSHGRACGIVTSGNYRKYYVRNGRKFAHTIDPRTGYPVSHSLLSATVTAADATTADALATFCMVAGLDEAQAFISDHEIESISLPEIPSSPTLEGYFIYDDNGTMRSCSSSLPYN